MSVWRPRRHTRSVEFDSYLHRGPGQPLRPEICRFTTHRLFTRSRPFPEIVGRGVPVRQHLPKPHSSRLPITRCSPLGEIQEKATTRQAL